MSILYNLYTITKKSENFDWALSNSVDVVSSPALGSTVSAS